MPLQTRSGRLAGRAASVVNSCSSSSSSRGGRGSSDSSCSSSRGGRGSSDSSSRQRGSRSSSLTSEDRVTRRSSCGTKRNANISIDSSQTSTAANVRSTCSDTNNSTESEISEITDITESKACSNACSIQTEAKDSISDTISSINGDRCINDVNKSYMVVDNKNEIEAFNGNKIDTLNNSNCHGSDGNNSCNSHSDRNDNSNNDSNNHSDSRNDISNNDSNSHSDSKNDNSNSDSNSHSDSRNDNSNNDSNSHSDSRNDNYSNDSNSPSNSKNDNSNNDNYSNDSNSHSVRKNDNSSNDCNENVTKDVNYSIHSSESPVESSVDRVSCTGTVTENVTVTNVADIEEVQHGVGTKTETGLEKEIKIENCAGNLTKFDTILLKSAVADININNKTESNGSVTEIETTTGAGNRSTEEIINTTCERLIAVDEVAAESSSAVSLCSASENIRTNSSSETSVEVNSDSSDVTSLASSLATTTLVTCSLTPSNYISISAEENNANSGSKEMTFPSVSLEITKAQDETEICSSSVEDSMRLECTGTIDNTAVRDKSSNVDNEVNVSCEINLANEENSNSGEVCDLSDTVEKATDGGTSSLQNSGDKGGIEGGGSAPTSGREYRCPKCSFVSNRAKLFLYHQKEAHGMDLAVYGCNKCEYASRHQNKVVRHKRSVHKEVEREEENSEQEVDRNSSAVQSRSVTIGEGLHVDCGVVCSMESESTTEGSSKISQNSAQGNSSSNALNACSLNFSTAVAPFTSMSPVLPTVTFLGKSSLPSAHSPHPIPAHTSTRCMISSGPAVHVLTGNQNTASVYATPTLPLTVIQNPVSLLASSNIPLTANQNPTCLQANPVVSNQNYSITDETLKTASLKDGQITGQVLNTNLVTVQVANSAHITSQALTAGQAMTTSSTVWLVPGQALSSEYLATSGKAASACQMMKHSATDQIGSVDVKLESSSVGDKKNLTATLGSDDAIVSSGSAGTPMISKERISGSVVQIKASNSSPASSDSDTQNARSSADFQVDYFNGTFRCSFCRYTNPHKWKIASHIRTSHSKKTIYKCPFCSFSTERKIEWCTHKTTHSGKAVFSCSECAYQTTMKRNYERHLERHLSPGPRRCSICSYSSTGEGAIQRHMAEYHPPSPGAKSVHASFSAGSISVDGIAGSSGAVIVNKGNSASANCGTVASVSINSNLVCSGSSVSASDKINTSTYCGFSEESSSMADGSDCLDVKSSSDVRIVLADDDDDDDDEEDDNESCSPSEASLYANIVLQPDVFVSTVSSKISDEVHSIEEVLQHRSVLGNTMVPLYRCHVCNLVVCNEAKMKVHMLSHAELKISGSVSQGSGSSRWTCALCPLTYQRPGDLNRHMKRKHGVTMKDVTAGRVPLVASEVFLSARTAQPETGRQIPPAHASSSYSSNLARLSLGEMDDESDDEDEAPLNLSVKIKDEPVDLVLTSPVQSEPLDLSTRPHNQQQQEEILPANQAPVKCPRCPYLSTRPGDLRRHATVHSKEKTYRCAQCAKSYKLQSDLNKHLNRVHLLGGRDTPPSELSTMTSDADLSGVLCLDESQDRDSDHSLAGIVIPTIPKALQELNRSLTDSECVASCKTNAAGKAPCSQTSGGSVLAGAISLTCRQCRYVGKSLSDIDRHTRLHSCDKPLHRCRFCDYATVWKGDVKRHLWKHHSADIGTQEELTRLVEQSHLIGTNPKNSASESVVRQFDHNMNVERRVSEALTHQSLGVNVAVASRSTSGIAREHNLFRCPLCSYASDVALSVKLHLEVHDNLHRFVCTVCGRRSNWVWAVQRHMRRDHPGADLMIRELSEVDARNTLESYLGSWKKVNTNNNNIDEDDDDADDDDDNVDHFNVNLRNAVESQALRSGLGSSKVPATDQERLTGQFADDSSSMCYGCPSINQNILNSDSASLNSATVELARNNVTNGSPNASDFQVDADALKSCSSVTAKKFRPYKCSQCGRRSNWRWDLNKHIRSSHPNAKLIELSVEEAKSTFQEEVLERDSKEKSAFIRSLDLMYVVPPPSSVATPTLQESSSSSARSQSKPFQCSQCGHRSNWKCDVTKHIRASHPNATVVILDEKQAKESLAEYDLSRAKPARVDVNRSDQSRLEVSQLEINKSEVSKCRMKVSLEAERSGGMIGGANSDMVDGMKLKRFQCSACPYRSNFRSDVGRHIRHKHDKNTSRIIVLSVGEAMNTLKSYLDTWARKKFVHSPVKRRSMPDEASKDDECGPSAAKSVCLDVNQSN